MPECGWDGKQFMPHVWTRVPAIVHDEIVAWVWQCARCHESGYGLRGVA